MPYEPILEICNSWPIWLKLDMRCLAIETTCQVISQHVDPMYDGRYGVTLYRLVVVLSKL